MDCEFLQRPTELPLWIYSKHTQINSDYSKVLLNVALCLRLVAFAGIQLAWRFLLKEPILAIWYNLKSKP